MTAENTALLKQLSNAVVANDPVPCTKEPELFYPEEISSGIRDDVIDSAKKLCASCPVEIICRSYALANKERYGIWGGTTAEDRQKIERRASRA